ncbi:alpha-amylase family protein [Paenibacillus sp. MY03]|uniref:alpha-amylase family protein n=1 Tax=Paenibacillus sp. MY03 TaxID=302980 RepID=UPI0015C5B0A7|nr:alpha-amylase family protein [Paenibacillus sp. MY03]
MKRLASRQVHLDFHTSEWIPNIGEKFDKKQFQQALQLGKVNSITVFAKCHHGWSYYPTSVGKVHPNLQFDLMKQQIEAAHEIGVRAPIYITVGFSANDAEEHPHWVVRNQDGSVTTIGIDPLAKPEDQRPGVSWKFLCPSGEYAEFIYAQTREVCNLYEVDGLFYDICFWSLCWCDNCRTGMIHEGLDPDSEVSARVYHKLKWQRFMSRCSEIIVEKKPDASIFFNGSASPYEPEWHDWQTHFELEDLPTTWGGYDKMPSRAKYFAQSGKDYLGMTGKFHTSWGEFGGFKSINALRYEVSSLLAYGARCNIGDQLHPSGQMDMETYRLIGEAYQYVEQIEPWCFDTMETTRLGIMLSGQVKSDEGLVKMLLEGHYDFDIVTDSTADLSRFETIILPDCILLNPLQAERLQAYMLQGGSLLLTGQSGLNEEKTHFCVDIGGSYMGKSKYDNDYLQLHDSVWSGLVNSPVLFYEGSELIEVTEGEVLASVLDPYFNRTYAQYCSHLNTPYQLDVKHPGVIRKGNVVYLAHSVCRNYYDHGAQFHRDYFLQALQLIYKNNVMEADMPSSGRARFVKQAEKDRYVLHLLYATPIQRGRTLVIDDLPPLYDVNVKVHVKEPIQRIYLAPEMKEIPFVQVDTQIEMKVPKVECHQIVVLDY